VTSIEINDPITRHSMKRQQPDLAPKAAWEERTRKESSFDDGMTSSGGEPDFVVRTTLALWTETALPPRFTTQEGA